MNGRLSIDESKLLASMLAPELLNYDAYARSVSSCSVFSSVYRQTYPKFSRSGELMYQRRKENAEPNNLITDMGKGFMGCRSCGSIYSTIMELGPKRPSLLWFWEPNFMIVVYMDLFAKQLFEIGFPSEHTKVSQAQRSYCFVRMISRKLVTWCINPIFIEFKGRLL